MGKVAFAASNGPKAIGPYSAALRAGQLVFVSGQVPVDPATGAMVEGDIGEQTRQVLQNLTNVLEPSGLTLAHVARTTVFLADMNDFAAMNEVYKTFFEEPYPARSTVQAARLPRDSRIEIDAIASFDA